MERVKSESFTRFMTSGVIKVVDSPQLERNFSLPEIIRYNYFQIHQTFQLQLYSKKIGEQIWPLIHINNTMSKGNEVKVAVPHALHIISFDIHNSQ